MDIKKSIAKTIKRSADIIIPKNNGCLWFAFGAEDMPEVLKKSR